MTDLIKTLTALKNAPQGDRGLDYEVDKALNLGMDFFERPRFTTSIDAALRLLERRLPGHRVSLFTNGGGEGPCCLIMLGDEPVKADVHAATLPLAILIALFKVLGE